MEQGLDDVIQIFGEKVHGALVELAPVDTGRFRGNMQITANKPPLYALNQYDKDGEKQRQKEGAHYTPCFMEVEQSTLFISPICLFTLTRLSTVIRRKHQQVYSALLRSVYVRIWLSQLKRRK
ncbi:putative head-tail adaptor [Salmonella virus STSR3]|nr:putative head-tail adaptor [Salmonella virus STSR3]